MGARVYICAQIHKYKRGIPQQNARIFLGLLFALGKALRWNFEEVLFIL